MPLDGYTDIGNVDEGDSIDPAYGDGIRANEAAFAGYLQSGSIVQASSAQVTINNSTTKTAILTYTIAADKLSTDNVYTGKIFCNMNNTTGSAETVTLSLGYGGTTLTTATGLSCSLGVQRFVMIEFILGANAATNAQWGGIWGIALNDTNNTLTGDRGTAAEDSTGDLNLVVSITWGSAAAGLTFVKYFSTVTYHEP
jgi:hypothetical protein